MIREKRYVVIKRTDLFRALKKREIERLEQLCLKVASFRRAAKKKPLMCVVGCRVTDDGRARLRTRAE